MTLGFSRWRVRIAATFAAAAVIALAACYLPNNFKAEIRLGKDGPSHWPIMGELVWAPLYRDIQNGKYSSEEIPKQVELIRKDLARDTNFKAIESMGQGRFKVEYEREGLMGPSKKSPSYGATRSSS